MGCEWQPERKFRLFLIGLPLLQNSLNSLELLQNHGLDDNDSKTTHHFFNS